MGVFLVSVALLDAVAVGFCLARDVRLAALPVFGLVVLTVAAVVVISTRGVW